MKEKDATKSKFDILMQWKILWNVCKKADNQNDGYEITMIWKVIKQEKSSKKNAEKGFHRVLNLLNILTLIWTLIKFTRSWKPIFLADFSGLITIHI